METSEVSGDSDPVREVRAIGGDARELAAALLQRVRRADLEAGIWEAADVQWWSREPRSSDEVEQVFWTDSDGPVAAVLVTDWGDVLQCDIIRTPTTPVAVTAVWERATEMIAALQPGIVEVPVREDDLTLRELVTRAGFDLSYDSTVAWTDAKNLPEVESTPEGFVLTDRATDCVAPYPMITRNGPEVEERLRLCSLYDPSLDLAVRTIDGEAAGYSLYWFDPATDVGLVEPMRVEDAYHRRGLGRAMLTAGLHRLAEKGARRIKIGYGTDAAGALYKSVGFRPTSQWTAYAKDSS